MKKWISKNGCPNIILKGKGFFISYLANSNWSGIQSFRGDGGSDETALVNPKAKIEYLILNGDFKKDYEKLINKGYLACKKFYNSKKEEFDSSWSGK